ncbi:MAG TPA: hypothetical protein VK302_08510 [Terriglobales bacterium]|nr:hypothetical protein [Terriglobales bacterium]
MVSMYGMWQFRRSFADAMQWESRYVDLPVFRGKPVLLVPKNIVRYDPAYKHGEYYQHFVLNYLQVEELHNPRLACIIREVEGARSLLCYKHVIKTVFGATEEASA